MSSTVLKQLSQIALVAGAASVAISAAIFLQDLVRGAGGRGQQAGLFVGLWAPSFIALSEMLDRVSEEDRQFWGKSIAREPVTERLQELASR